jgi:hypothetical protein
MILQRKKKEERRRESSDIATLAKGNRCITATQGKVKDY